MVLATGSQDDVPSTPPEKRLRLGSGNGGDGGGGGGGGGAGVAHGRRRFNGESIYFDDPIAMGLDSSLRYRELLEPAGRLQGLMVVTGGCRVCIGPSCSS